ncbi:transformation/transcription domain-associated protein-like [Notothenia coriiceps]|uniref:Transformation/transcription domain-associated protein-like n=1 Tax=Notothenia coriiceps TaxID=8208 RepID=A0A6I9Q4J1_9TELE|nr:PREDICTED: transformation/transcription domain-associated protein-like [Notothenia coriiceps]
MLTVRESCPSTVVNVQVFVLKFHTIARYQLVSIFKKCKPQSEMGVVEPGVLPGVPATPTPSTTPAILPPAPPTPVAAAPQPPSTSLDRAGEKEDKQTFQVSDCRSLVKTLVCGVKTITWGITSCKAPGEAQFIPNKQLQPKETQIYIKLVKYAMQALDIYQVQVANNQQTYIRVANCQTVRMKEEKEVLEHFAGVFTMMNPLTFKEIFQTTVPYMVERISKNYALQIVANSFLANLSTSALFATILVEYLLERLPEMGSNVELSNLYLKLFKLVFGSVSLFAAENEQMLKPHLHKIVNSSMELAQSAKEPYNYFLLLRALFRSIGGGSHDLLYQEFLPLLPNLLQGLNMLQSGLHKQHMKDLFVELCLTVPVRLSSLLPYLPMLMDPLVSALNGSQTLVSQGLRTLELCVDNLQPDFLYDHIQPVRAELMQPGEFLRIYNLRAIPGSSKVPGLTSSQKELDHLAFHLHGGNTFGRGIRVLPEDCPDVQEMKRRDQRPLILSSTSGSEPGSSAAPLGSTQRFQL